ncbi:MAG: peptidoglycan-binding protein [Alphaproteobacteria bacterium]|nr:peptidoglycan-binding protein [Alphaproteobacteria bacterium]
MKKLSTLALVSLCLIGAAGSANADMIVRDANNRQYVVRDDYNPNYRYQGGYYRTATTGYYYGAPERSWNATAHAQSRLMMLGYWVGPEGANGVISNHTVNAVKKFQRAHRLKVDGVVGERTASALERATYERYGYGYGYAPYQGGYHYQPASYYSYR